ncbi:8-oxo-dGTP pyrophosphatase MutT, NUDIX family [Chitinophaga jiangningensis]|uniref:8-oxo-dGTP pyrophosphatase MutT, NUDIX family n=1 Tax=Chitinophaga jiangningensis TaxID=1419482 RepID=A0A1M6YLN7_9BACT|nr:NUDIX domain-containing protein [Chitinophaga jiangningensis]SHL19224.1 8-oxo-dGTP pyrophosphatase MutT, NUDIX family [Chitinophaga jiangningensis]
MTTNINIYLNERPLLLSADRASIPAGFEDAVVYEDPNTETIEQVLLELEEGDRQSAVFIREDVKQLLKKVSLHFTVLVAAGGLVTNEDKEVLMMFRRGKWDLPKGKQDPGEDLETCALREVAEETGLHNIKLTGKITETFHYYPMKNKKVLKHTYWYRMEFTGTELTVPQIEEDILDIQWVKPHNVEKYLQFSYENIREVFNVAKLMTKSTTGF